MTERLIVREVRRLLAELHADGRRIGQRSSAATLAGSREEREKLVSDAGNYFLSKLIPALLGFLSVVIFVRLLGYEQYGRYAVVLVVVMATASGMAGWLAQGILRFQSQPLDPGESEGFQRAGMTGAVLSIVLGGAGLAGVMCFSGIQKGLPLLISVALFAVLILYTIAIARFQASLHSRRVLRFEIVRAIGSLTVPLALILLTGLREYWLVILGIAVGYSLPLLGQTLFGTWNFGLSRVKAGSYFSVRQRGTLGRLWRFGWPVALWLLCQQCLLVSDRFFLQRFAGYPAAGVYSSIYDVVVRSFSLLFMPVTLAVHPLIMNQWNAGNPKAAFAVLRAGVKYQVLMFLPIIAGFAFLNTWISRFVLGRETPAAAAIVVPLAVSGFLWQLALLAHKPLEILCLTKRMLAAMLIALAVNASGNWLLIPRLGYLAAAYLSLASSATYLLMVFVLTPVRRFRHAAELQTAVCASGSGLVSEDFLPEAL